MEGSFYAGKPSPSYHTFTFLSCPLTCHGKAHPCWSSRGDLGDPSFTQYCRGLPTQPPPPNPAEDGGKKTKAFSCRRGNHKTPQLNPSCELTTPLRCRARLCASPATFICANKGAGGRGAGSGGTGMARRGYLHHRPDLLEHHWLR